MLSVLSVFSGGGGMDIGMEGGFSCLARTINTTIRTYWVSQRNGDCVELK